jgi:hypothetical protein
MEDPQATKNRTTESSFYPTPGYISEGTKSSIK